MSETASALDANAAFYRAFAAADAEAMAEIWARRLPVACVHPGARVIIGRAAVVRSWQQLLRRRAAIRFVEPGIVSLGEVAIVSGYEQFADGVLLAVTNIFAVEDGHWRMIHHHAGQIAQGRMPAAEERPPPRHRLH